MILALSGSSWIVADDFETEAELRELAARLADVLVESVKGAA